MELYIVNRFDRPAPEHIAEKREDGFYYIHPELAGKKDYWGMTPEEPTPISEFGIDVELLDGILHGALNHPSKATYPDGRIRNWQGDEKFQFPYPPAPQVIGPDVDVLSVDQFIEILGDGDSNDDEITKLQDALHAAADLLDEDGLFKLEQKLAEINGWVP